VRQACAHHKELQGASEGAYPLSWRESRLGLNTTGIRVLTWTFVCVSQAHARTIHSIKPHTVARGALRQRPIKDTLLRTPSSDSSRATSEHIMNHTVCIRSEAAQFPLANIAFLSRLSPREDSARGQRAICRPPRVHSCCQGLGWHAAGIWCHMLFRVAGPSNTLLWCRRTVGPC
jgi:hypothetical protein